MCLIALAYEASEKYKIVIAANRDEFLDRPAAPAYWWEGADLLAGRDIRAKGTWLGITRTGRIAAITNYRDLINKKEFSTSRGSLVTGFLLTGISPEKYLEALSRDARNYDGYNLIWGTPSELFYFSNKEGDGIKLGKGVHLLSNHLLNTPWFKSVKFREGFEKILQNEGDPEEQLLTLLKDPEKAPDTMLPSTGLPYDAEKNISSVYITMGNYGTRCSTIITIDYDDNVVFTEAGHQPEKNFRKFNFRIEPPQI